MISGPLDEYERRSGHGVVGRTCRLCAIAAEQRWFESPAGRERHEAEVRSGRMAERVSRYLRERADTRDAELAAEL